MSRSSGMRDGYEMRVYTAKEGLMLHLNKLEEEHRKVLCEEHEKVLDGLNARMERISSLSKETIFSLRNLIDDVINNRSRGAVAHHRDLIELIAALSGIYEISAPPEGGK